MPTDDKRHSLGKKLYNDLLVHFVAVVIDKVSIRDRLEVDLTDSIRALNTWISDEAAESLRRFSEGANKSTLNGHPCDQERWNTFVINAYKSGNSLPTHILYQPKFSSWSLISASFDRCCDAISAR